MDDNRCRGCGDLCEYIYCALCAPKVMCPHDKDPADCDDCDRLSDIAYDAQKGGGC